MDNTSSSTSTLNPGDERMAAMEKDLLDLKLDRLRASYTTRSLALIGSVSCDCIFLTAFVCEILCVIMEQFSGLPCGALSSSLPLKEYINDKTPFLDALLDRLPLCPLHESDERLVAAFNEVVTEFPRAEARGRFFKRTGHQGKRGVCIDAVMKVKY